MYRTRKHYNGYQRYLADRARQHKHPINDCILCGVDGKDSNFISQTKYFKLIRNKFPYSAWDYQRVVDHLMLVPLVHTDNLASLSKEARLEYVEEISSYESNGYHVYARATKSDAKSIPHQHTHLIKCVGRSHYLVFYLLKPYVSIVR